ncbi:hypothetical protein DSM104299_04435 [Baekduia alba]|uniref:ATP-binding protein n=1 Tax=Baekduia alba TaxID=2997333 RepID=UPI00234250BC|nr:ATP-binding protein [Baekduia alba]WCB95686.1 hypothetical protein DSM104299_04435 [Baekduia alba]
MEFDVALTKQHLESLARTQPLTGVIELIWNALDADATEIGVEFGRNVMDGLEEIRVRDNGHGILAREAESLFGALGFSWKRDAQASRGGRPLHGREGRGRYRAAGIGTRIIWRTVAADPEASGQHMQTSIELQFSNLVHVIVSEAAETEQPTGTTVVIPDLGAKPPVGLGGTGPVDRLTAVFALSLQTFNAHISYDRTEIDPSKAQVHRADYPLEAEGDDALLTVVEWNRRIDRGLYLCDSKGTPLIEQPPGIQAPGFEFTAYLQWTGFEGSDEADLQMANLDSGERKRLIEAAKDQLREHFKVRLQEKTREQITRWKAEKTYPFKGEPTTRTERTVRDVFDVVALTASSAVNASEVRSRRLSLRLLREALEQDPGSLHRVLHEVLDLPQDRLDELSELLDRTPLAALISLSKEVADRLEFLKGLEELVLNPEIKKHVKERSQLHKILAAETWVFGEEYALSVNDEGLTTVLQRHIELLGRAKLDEDDAPVKDLEGHERIVDLMLARSLGQARNRREHLVVELKRPSVAVGDDEASQIRKYATAVAGDPRFSSVDVQWDFVVVSTDVKGSPAIERESDNRPFGQIMNAKGIRVWVLTWGEVLDNALHRLKFAKQHLDYEPSTDQALAYLRRTHDKYLPPQARSDGNDSVQTTEPAESDGS